MTDFRFLHAADIHLDSPLHGLSRYEGLPEAEIRGATRAAFDNLVRLAINEAVNFVVLAGDLFDGDWKDMGTGLYFARAMGELHLADIPVFLLAGNHDAASVISRSIPWPPNVRVFDARRPQTHRLDDLKVAVHGQSFSTPAVTDNLVLAYPDRLEHHFNVGMLHTALAGRSGHAPYAPCSLDDLKAKHYDYWALGHVHEFERVCEAPHVIFPGNLQGRTIREAGPKGVVLVSVRDGAVEAVDRVALDVLRWAAVTVDCTDASAQTAADLIQAALASAWQSQTQSLPLIARLTLVGQTDDAGALLDGASGLRDVARALAAAISPYLYIEKVRVQVHAKPVSTKDFVSEDFTAALAQAASAPELAALLAEDLQPFLLAAQTGLDTPDDTDLRRSAADGDWGTILDAAALALQSRLLRAA
ncbi:metallophosphoesterase family protein [Brevundimonas phoenicis]|uniref:metallophosphoesterase family protein n=1 Tax=unclassified Brevundimonas TaxID=2622653 RepID=UPI0039A39CAE